MLRATQVNILQFFGLSGGLIGPPGTQRNYKGDLNGVDIFIGCSDIDPHIHNERIDETEKVFKSLNARITKRIYQGMAHTIIKDEINFINRLLKERTKG